MPQPTRERIIQSPNELTVSGGGPILKLFVPHGWRRGLDGRQKREVRKYAGKALVS